MDKTLHLLILMFNLEDKCEKMCEIGHNNVSELPRLTQTRYILLTYRVVRIVLSIYQRTVRDIEITSMGSYFGSGYMDFQQTEIFLPYFGCRKHEQIANYWIFSLLNDYTLLWRFVPLNNIQWQSCSIRLEGSVEQNDRIFMHFTMISMQTSIEAYIRAMS